MTQPLSVIGPNLLMDSRGKLFEKVAGDARPIKNKYTEAEDRYVADQLRKGECEDEAGI